MLAISDEESEMHSLKLRILRGGDDLPGDSLAEEEDADESIPSHFACLFYQD
jgi:hypothetical protein